MQTTYQSGNKLLLPYSKTRDTGGVQSRTYLHYSKIGQQKQTREALNSTGLIIYKQTTMLVLDSKPSRRQAVTEQGASGMLEHVFRRADRRWLQASACTVSIDYKIIVEYIELPECHRSPRAFATRAPYCLEQLDNSSLQHGMRVYETSGKQVLVEYGRQVGRV